MVEIGIAHAHTYIRAKTNTDSRRLPVKTEVGETEIAVENMREKGMLRQRILAALPVEFQILGRLPLVH